VHVERAQCVAIVGRHEHDGRHRVRADQLEQREAVDFGHLDVEEQDVGTQPCDERDRIGTAGLADDVDVGVVREQRFDVRSRERFVVDDEYLERPVAGAVHAAACHGRSSTASTPSSLVPRLKAADSP
jgi:hypothetical protein